MADKIKLSSIGVLFNGTPSASGETVTPIVGGGGLYTYKYSTPDLSGAANNIFANILIL